ncbi:cysteine--tRNA ligase [Alicyclobacillus sp. SO9]|uniref:cysteine--tRNA ligase n=1 Tax=Alicyclobacillus sp. SO9 TaxID=2665646 RepID=UPI0018E79C9C|nr:cysteine--tRNA ligase [Alicyclobacillus sp. SO9]QQE78548.1 cysteine--tRNA ligase [Alicyclobacillus sp. SO9]
MGITLYNSMTRRKEELETIEPGKVRFYACGPTVYNLFHLGNARMFVVFDMIRRYLEYRGYEVKFVQNFTDVDDRIIQRANELKLGFREVANRYIAAYFEDADALGIERATVHPRVTECIPDIVSFVADLVDSGHAYERDGNVYFDASSFPEYGKLSGHSIAEVQSGFRIEVHEHKDDPADFALWKAAKPDEEYWESPWGPGRPGWHIECSVMNAKYLGEQIDIHAGGRDLIFPHHENEIAQTEAHFHKEFSRYWLHNGTLNINGEKMSKSTGNFIMTRDLLKQRPARAVRYYLLSAQYRNPLNFTEEGMDQAENALGRVDRSVKNLRHRVDGLRQQPHYLIEALSPDKDQVALQVASVRTAFTAAMDDDFNSADGIAAIFEGVRQANTYVEQQNATPEGLQLWIDTIEELMAVLGLHVESEVGMLEADILKLIEDRNEARARRDFQRADEIRDELQNNGIILEDTPQGTRWHKP